MLALGPIFLLVHVAIVRSKVDATQKREYFYVFDVMLKVCV